MADNGTKEETILHKAREVKDKVASRFKACPNVTGVGVGYKVVNGRRTDVICIRVYVKKKLPKRDLSPEQILPESVEGLPVDVIEAIFQIQQGRSAPSIEEHRRHHDPLVGGISIINLNIENNAGTLGVSVFDNISGWDMILSNWHVLCGRFDCAVGEPVVQPGTLDGGGPEDLVARLHRFALTDEVDAAIASLTGHRFLLGEVLGLRPVSGVGTAALGMRVRKSGRTTGVTVGTIVDESADVDVEGYPDGTRAFRNQIVIEDGIVSKGGDSGSIWIDDSNRAIGLLFAGSRDGKHANANPISAVLQALDINLRVGVSRHDFVVML